MVETKEMQGAVHSQQCEFLSQRTLALSRAAGRNRQRDHDFAQLH